MRKNYWVYGAIVFVFLACSGCGKTTQQNRVKVIQANDNYQGNMPAYTVASYVDLNEEYKLSCFYRASEEFELSFGVSGEHYEEVNVYTGSKVKKGELLAELDTVELKEQLAIYQSQVALLQKQEKHFKQLGELIEQQLGCAPNATIRKKVMQDKEENDEMLRSNQNSLAVAKEYEKETNAKLMPRQLIADMDGIVSFVKAFDSETLSQEGECFLKLVNDDFYFQSEVKEKVKLKEGMEVNIRVAEQDYQAKVSMVKKKKGATIIQYHLEDATASFTMNTLGEVQVPVDTYQHVLAIPSDCIFELEDQPCVRVVDDNGYQSVRKVTLGISAEKQTEITGGLSEGERVAAR